MIAKRIRAGATENLQAKPWLQDSAASAALPDNGSTRRVLADLPTPPSHYSER